MRARQSQFGVVLITSLVMLIVMTLIGLAAIRLSTVNLRIVNNVQLRQEERSVVQGEIEKFINSDFSVGWASGTAVPAISPVEIYDGREFEVTLNRCMKGVTYVSNSDIFTECYKTGAALSEVDTIGYCACIEKADYEARFGNESQIRGADGVLASGTKTLAASGTAASGLFDPSRCGRVRFNISGSVTDTFSGAWTTINQGVVLLKSETRVKQLREMNSSCPS